MLLRSHHGQAGNICVVYCNYIWALAVYPSVGSSSNFFCVDMVPFWNQKANEIAHHVITAMKFPTKDYSSRSPFMGTLTQLWAFCIYLLYRDSL